MTKARENSDYTGLQGDLAGLQTNITAGDTAARAGRKNWIINGDFQISQRGSYTSATALTSSSVYHLDRFKSKHNNISGTITHKLAQTVNGKVTNTMLLTATAGSNGRVEGVQQIEATKPFVSQTITFSAWVKSNSASSRLIIHQDGANIQTSSNQHTGGGAFELLKGTVTCAANSGNIFLYAGIQAAGTGNVAIANGDYFEMAFVQIELGSVATDFEHRSYGEELALCQRYFSYQTNLWCNSGGTNGDRYSPRIFYPVTMRSVASVTLSSVTTSNMTSPTPHVMSKDGTVLYANFNTTALDGHFTIGVLTADAEL